MGMLNARERFGPPALASAMFNVVAIVGGFVLWAMGLSHRAVAVGWAVATLFGGLAQFAIQLPRLLREGWRFHFDWAPDDVNLRAIASLMAPATIGMAAVPINLLVSSRFASSEGGAVSWLDYAFRILYLPIGVFGVAVGTVATTGLAKQAAARDLAAMADTIRRSLRNLAFLTIPSTVGLVVLAAPIVRLLYERGKFTSDNTPPTAAALAIYALGLVAYSSIKVLAPAFYALGHPRVPLIASAAAVASNVATMVLLHPYFGHGGVAAGVVVSTFINVLVLGVALRRAVGPFGGPGLWGFLARVVGSALMMGVVASLAARAVESRLGTHGLVARALDALVPVSLGAAVYFGLTALLQVGEARSLLAAVRRRR
jgi:putative peptidoglycan lipid II flippase